MRIVHLLLATMLAGSPAVFAPAQAQVAASMPVLQAKLLSWRNRWVIEAEIAGKKREYLLDTAAGLTLVSADTAKAAGCTPWGRMTGYQMMGTRLDGPRCNGLPMTIAGVALTPPVTGLIDMGKNNPADAELDGVIGLNLFEGRTVTIDFAAGRLTVESDASRDARAARMTPLPVRISREVGGLALVVLVRVPTEKGSLWMELDSGNGGTILVSQPYAALLGMDPAAQGKQRADFGVTGAIRATTDDAFTPDMIIDGNLGMPFLRNWVVMMDLATSRAWLGVPPVPPARAAPLPPTPDSQATPKP